jgi:hypothetical protein
MHGHRAEHPPLAMLGWVVLVVAVMTLVCARWLLLHAAALD